MTDLYGLSTTATPTRVGEGTKPLLRSTRDATLFTADWWEGLAHEGRILHANMGTVTTPLTFLVTAANRPDAWIRVPSGTTILPLACHVILESAAGTVTEMDLRRAANDIGNGTSTAASVGPLSNRSDAIFTSACTARQLATADTTAETSPISLYRRTYPFAVATAEGHEPLGMYADRAMMGYPILVGPATWELFVAATTTQATGYVIFHWAEIPSTAVV